MANIYDSGWITKMSYRHTSIVVSSLDFNLSPIWCKSCHTYVTYTCCTHDKSNHTHQIFYMYYENIYNMLVQRPDSFDIIEYVNVVRPSTITLKTFISRSELQREIGKPQLMKTRLNSHNRASLFSTLN